MYIHTAIILISSTISLSEKENKYHNTIPSPTLNQPLENLSEKQTKQLIEKIFIDTVKQELNDKK